MFKKYFFSGSIYWACMLVVSLFVCSGLINDANAAAFTWDGNGGIVDTNWNTAINWEPDGIPGSGDTVTFNGTNYDCIINVPVTVAGIIVTTGYTGKITQNANVTISGDFSVDGTGTRWGHGDYGLTLTVGGNFSALGTNSVDLRTNGNENTHLILSGSGMLNVKGLYDVFLHNLTCAQSGNTTTLGGNIQVADGLNVGSGNFNLGGYYVANFSKISRAEGGTITNGLLQLRSVGDITLPGGTYPGLWADPVTGTITLGGNITCTYIRIDNDVPDAVSLDTGANNYSITAEQYISIGDLTLKNGHLKCNGSTIKAGTNVNIYGTTSILDAGSSRWSIGGIWSRNASAAFKQGTSTVEFTNTNTLPASSWYNLTISGSGTTTLSGNCTVANSLTISSGATLNSGNYNVTVNGDLINSSTFSSLNLTLNGNLTNGGTLNTASLTIPANKIALLQEGSIWSLKAGETLTVCGTLKSAGTSGNPAKIQSSSTFGNIVVIIKGGSVENKDGIESGSSVVWE